MTSDGRRRGVLAGFSNSADLGGLRLHEGGVTMSGRVIRSDVPTGLSDVDRRAAVDHGFAALVDLRSAEEVLAQPHPLAELTGYRNLPLIDPAAEQTRDPAGEPTVGDVYVASLSRNAGRIGEVFNALAETASGPVMICCTAGRDRTGMVVALLLSTAGVDREAIVDDYSLVGPSTPSPPTATGLRSGSPGAPVRRGADDIRRMVDHVDSTWGGSAAYLGWLGLDQGAVNRVSQRLLR